MDFPYVSDDDEELDGVTVKQTEDGIIWYNADTHIKYKGTAARGWWPKAPKGSEDVVDTQKEAQAWVDFFKKKNIEDAMIEDGRRIQREMREKVENFNKQRYRRSNSPEY